SWWGYKVATQSHDSGFFFAEKTGIEVYRFTSINTCRIHKNLLNLQKRIMEAIIIYPGDESDLNIFLELAKKLKLKSKTLSAEAIEELCLINAINEGRKTQFVSKESIISKLNK
ncbi:MAG TPA: hypothetical protein PKN32_03765, partial [Bacteroidales bacterium]|nr:hypothetical protein [Bacteroidales bacterium]